MSEPRGDLLIIFYRNPEFGKVKTRLASALGEDKALAIYLKLVGYTREITAPLQADKVVYYSEFVDTEDQWNNLVYSKKRQTGATLGDRMRTAFEDAFANGYKSVCIIGTDCLELTKEIITEAFNKLKSYDAVIGPAIDGGYYLLGMNQLYSEVFKNKSWGTETVLQDTLDDFRRLNILYATLPELNDVDKVEDLPIAFQSFKK